ncbi:MAG: hypothetical protein IPN62_18895 [Flavobacteriales bacterium]|nr:hypothetical protein [Flavobacteriales bacterium]
MWILKCRGAGGLPTGSVLLPPLTPPMLTSREIRQKFLDHFAQRGHTIVPSAPMVVKDDPTLMFTNAGMNQFRTCSLETARPSTSASPTRRSACAFPGKHNDLEEVGIDTYHHTMFEMLGNWSFETTSRPRRSSGRELLVDEYRIDTNDLYVTYFGGDARTAWSPMRRPASSG